MAAVRIILYITAVAAAFLSFLYCETWVTFLILILVIFLPLLSVAIGMLNARKISYRVSAPRAVGCGEVLEVLVADNSGINSLNYNVTLSVDKGYDEEKIWSAGLVGGTSQKYTVRPEHCSTIRCSVKKAGAYDALGLFRLPLRPVSDTVVCVLPKPVPPDELPEYSLAMHQIYVPKYGGGFAEVHDVRPYRPGDSMRDIHWKLSAKTDRLVVREPQNPVCSSILITVDLEAPSQRMDMKIANLLWVSRWLLSKNVEHDVCWLDPAERQVRTFSVTQTTDPVSLVREMMVRRVTEPLPSIADMPFAKVDWHYHITGEVQK